MCIVQEELITGKSNREICTELIHVHMSVFQLCSPQAATGGFMRNGNKRKKIHMAYDRDLENHDIHFRTQVFPLHQRTWTLQERQLSTKLFQIAAPEYWFEFGVGMVDLNGRPSCNDMNNNFYSTGTFLGFDTSDRISAQVSGTMKPIQFKIRKT
jgi:hypothetical protein